jgi:phosphoribosylamine-glycine ligase
MPDFKNMKCLCWDTGLFTEHCVRLAKDFGTTWHFSSWQTLFPNFKDFAVGLGMEGLKKALDFEDYEDDADLIFFPDVHKGGKIEKLRKQGKIVFGGGRGEVLELRREIAHKIQKQIGLPTQNYIVLSGVDAVENYIKQNPNKKIYVKVDIFRENLESLKSINYKSSKIVLDNVRAMLGPFADSFQFIIEDEIDGVVEPGFDLFFNGKEFLKPYLWGYEYHSIYGGVYTDTLPMPLRQVAEAIKPILQKFNYRGAISCEMIINKEGAPFVIDWTCRFASPMSVFYTESIKNYSDVIWAVANGENITLDVTSKYVGALPLDSDYAKDHWLELSFDKNLRDKIKLRVAAKYKDAYYAVPGLSGVVVLCAFDNKLDNIRKELLALIPKVQAYQLEQEELSGGVDHIYETIERGRSIGLEF